MILAIDPGCWESGWVVLDGEKPYRFGKTANEELLGIIRSRWHLIDNIVIEQLTLYPHKSSITMEHVLWTAEWIGRFVQLAHSIGIPVSYIYRSDERKTIIGKGEIIKNADKMIRERLIERFAPGIPNRGKGTKKEPGWFYGFSEDVWQAYAVGITWLDNKRAKDSLSEAQNSQKDESQ